jgi:SAM-dependent methyltransferase
MKGTIMEETVFSADYDDPVVAELYDMRETYTDDIDLIRKLLGRKKLKVLECFSGTGRILLALVRDGHKMTGYEIAPNMNARAVIKALKLDDDSIERVKFDVRDVLEGDWGTGFDAVILGANAFYELPSADAQEKCVQYASEALKKGGHVFIDNDDYKGDWGKGPFGEETVVFEGTAGDGTYGRWSREGVSFDASTSTSHFRRKIIKRSPEGEEEVHECTGMKHPVTKAEVESWLLRHGFGIEQLFGDRKGNPYTPESERAIFWARKM